MPTRQRYHHGDLRAALLRASTEQILAVGAESFSLSDAARAVGVSPSAAYRHFADRDALLAAVAAEGFTRLTTAMASAVDVAGDDPVARLAAVGEAYVLFATSDPAVFRVMFGHWGAGSPAFAEATTASPSGASRMLAHGLDALVETGVLSSRAREGAELPLWSAVHGLASLLVDGPLRFETDAARGDLINRVIDSAIAGILHGSSGRHPTTYEDQAGPAPGGLESGYR